MQTVRLSQRDETAFGKTRAGLADAWISVMADLRDPISVKNASLGRMRGRPEHSHPQTAGPQAVRRAVPISAAPTGTDRPWSPVKPVHGAPPTGLPVPYPTRIKERLRELRPALGIRNVLYWNVSKLANGRTTASNRLRKGRILRVGACNQTTKPRQKRAQYGHQICYRADNRQDQRLAKKGTPVEPKGYAMQEPSPRLNVHKRYPGTRENGREKETTIVSQLKTLSVGFTHQSSSCQLLKFFAILVVREIPRSYHPFGMNLGPGTEKIMTTLQDGSSAHATAAGGYVQCPRFFKILGTACGGGRSDESTAGEWPDPQPGWKRNIVVDVVVELDFTGIEKLTVGSDCALVAGKRGKVKRKWSYHIRRCKIYTHYAAALITSAMLGTLSGNSWGLRSSWQPGSDRIDQRWELGNGEERGQARTHTIGSAIMKRSPSVNYDRSPPSKKKARRAYFLVSAKKQG
ncbi:hypothetical protein B0H13DRAFT_1864382 [Mycena leptocephala]|nr:hypothetical protein B0H13DRAFT_1864382 [Mycena leptocephala]